MLDSRMPCSTLAWVRQMATHPNAGTIRIDILIYFQSTGHRTAATRWRLAERLVIILAHAPWLSEGRDLAMRQARLCRLGMLAMPIALSVVVQRGRSTTMTYRHAQGPDPQLAGCFHVRFAVCAVTF